MRSLILVILSAVGAAALPSSNLVDASCTVTSYSVVPNAVSSCTALTLSNIAVPGGSTLDLSGLKDGSTVTFAGRTTFGYKEGDSELIKVSGKDITILGQKGAIIDGNGGAWWDGQGGNGGVTKPSFLMALNKVTGKSVIRDLYIQNYPTSCFHVTGNTDSLVMQNLVLNNSAGDAPNKASGGLPAAHNTDGFDISSSTNVLLSNIQVFNQDDCVAVTSGNNITATGMTCVGGHGLSIGSVGGKSNNIVQNVKFLHSSITNSQNGARIKTNSGTTGAVAGITYQNITLSNISDYGIDIQQDYDGTKGKPTNGVKISGIMMAGITGTVKGGKDYYILCGSGSCSNFNFNDIQVTGGSGDSCNYKPNGEFKC